MTQVSVTLTGMFEHSEGEFAKLIMTKAIELMYPKVIHAPHHYSFCWHMVVWISSQQYNIEEECSVHVT